MKKRAHEIAYDFIKTRILDGTYRPAERLLEAKLSEEIGVSRNTVKKALLTLEQEQLIELTKNKGASIRSLDIDEVIQYMEIREELEVKIARIAATAISEKAIREMEKIFDTMKDLSAIHDYDTYSLNNKKFHAIIYEAASKPILTMYCMNIKTQLSRYQFKTMLVPQRSDNSLLEHEAILQSMQSHDADAAERAIRAHMSNLLATIIKYKNLVF